VVGGKKTLVGVVGGGGGCRGGVGVVVFCRGGSKIPKGKNLKNGEKSRPYDAKRGGEQVKKEDVSRDVFVWGRGETNRIDCKGGRPMLRIVLGKVYVLRRSWEKERCSRSLKSRLNLEKLSGGKVAQN